MEEELRWYFAFWLAKGGPTANAVVEGVRRISKWQWLGRALLQPHCRTKCKVSAGMKAPGLHRKGSLEITTPLRIYPRKTLC